MAEFCQDSVFHVFRQKAHTDNNVTVFLFKQKYPVTALYFYSNRPAHRQ